MRYLIASVAIVLGLTLLMGYFVVTEQLREIARSPTPMSLENYPLLEFVGGDLFRDTDPDITPAEMADHVQQRISLIGIGGLVFILAGIAFFVLTMPRKARPNRP